MISKEEISEQRKKLDPVIFDYFQLLDKDSDLSEQIFQAYGPDGAGISLIKNVPNYQQYRLALLPLAKELADLPSQISKKYEIEEAFFSVGINTAKQKTDKETDNSISFYADPNRDIPLDYKKDNQTKDSRSSSFPNVWPEDVPKLEKAFKNLGTLFYDVGLLLAFHFDKYVKKLIPNYEDGKIKRLIYQANGRLIHYPDKKIKTESENWVFWHCDFSEITGLCSPMYINEKSGEILDLVDDENSGLEIIRRDGSHSLASIPNDCMAFQTGECVQVHTGGRLVATPHRVFQGDALLGKGISRNQFVCFFNPPYDEKMTTPPGIERDEVFVIKTDKIPRLEDRWQGGETYRNYNDKTYSFYVKK